MKLWIVLTASALNHPEYTAKSQKPNIHGVYGSEEEMLKHAAPDYTPQRFFDTGLWTWGSSGTQFWAVPFLADSRELRTVLGQQWFAPSYKAPEPDQEVVVAIAGDSTPHKARYVGDGVFTLLGYHDGTEELRAESVAAWRPLPERGEAWPVEPVSFQIRSF